MAKYFKLSELYKSDKAIAHEIDNIPTPEAVDNIELLINECLDVIREAYGSPIYVNSGYRCEALNKLVKGAKNSHHMTGKAADITVKSKAANKKLFKLIEGMIKIGELKCTQLIDEYDYQWVHISYDKGNLKNQILHLK